jgi:isochorismate synthase EntC
MRKFGHLFSRGASSEVEKLESPLFEIARVLVRFDHVTSRIVTRITASYDRLQKVVFSRELELAAQLLLSGWAILDRLHLLRGLVSFLRRD